MGRGFLKWTVRSVAVLAVLYAALFGGIALAMLQTPERFGMVMRYVPGVLVWGLLPAADMWLWARQGDLQTGDPAPDFTLPLQDGSGEVTLSSYRGRQPVVLVFGSYT